MAEVISLAARRKGKQDATPDDLNDLIRRASVACKGVLNFQPDELTVVREEGLRSIFEGKISEEIFRRKLVASDVLLCGIYVSKLLAELTLTVPESWWAVDYAGSEDPAVLKRGGDTCFVICGVFPERGDYRLMDASYYERMGAGLYYQFYAQAGKEIGYHMSHQFSTMVQVVQNSLSNF